MNETLQEFVKNAWVKQYTPKPVERKASHTKAKLLENAGFETIALEERKQAYAEDHLSDENEAVVELSKKHILLKVPNFESRVVLSSRALSITGIFTLIAIAGITLVIYGLLMFSIAITALGAIALSVGGLFTVLIIGHEAMFDVVKLKNGKLLYRTAPESFTGAVPTQVAETLMEYKKQGFSRPEVWGIASANELHNYVIGRTSDPLLVFPINNMNNYVILAAVWGEDIENLDKYFKEEKQ